MGGSNPEWQGFPRGSVVKNPSAMQEMGVRSLGWEDPLAERMSTFSSILPWRILSTGEPGRLQSMGHKELDMTEQRTHFSQRQKE